MLELRTTSPAGRQQTCADTGHRQGSGASVLARLMQSLSSHRHQTMSKWDSQPAVLTAGPVRIQALFHDLASVNLFAPTLMLDFSKGCFPSGGGTHRISGMCWNWQGGLVYRNSTTMHWKQARMQAQASAGLRRRCGFACRPATICHTSGRVLRCRFRV